jgi:hypothetical protein
MRSTRLSALLAPSLLLLVPACSDDETLTTGPSGSGGDGGAGVTVVTVATSTTSGGPDIGEPSDTYPAPHPASPVVARQSGPVLTAPVFVPVFFASDDAATKTAMTTYLQQIGSTDYWTQVTQEYGVGPGTSLPAIELDEAPGTKLDDADIQAWLAAKLNADDPAFPVPDDNTLFAIYYPAGVTITLGGTDQSCFSFGAYHSSVRLDAAHGDRDVAYAVMPRCGTFGSLNGLDALAGPTSHELIEAATDPHPLVDPAYGQTDLDHWYWSILLGGEVSDLCAQERDAFTFFPGLDYAAQRSWSNASALAGHDPCVPLAPGVAYFNASPELPDRLDLGGGLKVKGIKIAEGESRTIDVSLFSDAPTQPFWVEARDATHELGAGGGLDFEFDADEGQNGQTLHLTISVSSASQYDFELFYLVSHLGNRQHTWIGAVGQ